MIAREPAVSLWDEDLASQSFTIERPADGKISTLIFASPHSGRIYPAEMMAASRLDSLAIRRSEDAYVDHLIGRAPDHAVTVIAARFARVFMDVNREPWDLDPAMFADELPHYARSRSARVAAGLGSIARVVREGEEIYARKLRFSDARSRVETVHTPYHNALAGLVREAQEARSVAVLIDWHSMPAAAAQGADIVLGDRFGGSCAPACRKLVEHAFQSMGYVVARNKPYAGGYTTEHYGQPARGVHALQIEINRSLYMDEASLRPTSGFDALCGDIDRVTKTLAGTQWLDL